MNIRRFELGILVTFVISGFAGLIYQSIWSHYFGLVLGHSAYAQTLVLAIFMGGMSIGAWLVSRRSQKIRRFLLMYALAELVIGIVGLLFHPLFLGYQAFTYETALPGIGGAWGADAYLWLSCALLMLPQSVLLGTTFPLMSSAVMQSTDSSDEKVLGGLYFANSIGAAFGALASTFLIMPMVGLPGTMLTAALLNIAVAFFAWTLFKARAGAAESPATDGARHVPAPVAADGDARWLALILPAAAFITGATSFIYEIGWVRSLNQTLGASVHSFELMLAAFILGLACGGLWIRQNAARIRDSLHYAAGAQILMGIFALFSLVAFSNSFHWMAWIMNALSRTDNGYTLFSLGSSLISLVVMFPAAFFAGMTLPLFTAALLRSGHGEASIGKIYAANTLGAIFGVFVCTHVLIPMFSLHTAIAIAAILDIVLGFYLFRKGRGVFPVRFQAAYAVLCVAALGLALVWGKPDPREQIAGVYRTGTIYWGAGDKMEFFQDGKTATIGVRASGDLQRSIVTNGKPDASMVNRLAEKPTPDEPTMIVAGVLSVVMPARADEIAVIGWGSGLSTHTVLGSDAPRRVETIEIERMMYEGAKYFGSRVERAYEDKRSVAVIEDARSHFARSAKRYDAIISEPSNPWVAGVAGLFTREFYGMLANNLADDGVLVQWLQTYELNDELLGTMLAALCEVYPHIQVYESSKGDLLFLAGKQPLREPDFSRFRRDVVRDELKRVSIEDEQALALRLIADRPMLMAYTSALSATPHSDFFPVVTLNAPRARFLNQSAGGLASLTDIGLPLIDELSSKRPPDLAGVRAHQGSSQRSLQIQGAAELLETLRSDTLAQSWAYRKGKHMDSVIFLKRFAGQPVTDEFVGPWQEHLTIVISKLLPNAVNAEVRAMLESTVIRPDLENSDPAVAEAYAAIQTIVARDHAAILALPTDRFVGAETGIDPVAGEFVLAAQMLSAIKRGDTVSMAALMERNERYTASQRMATARLLLKHYALAAFSGDDRPAPGG